MKTFLKIAAVIVAIVIVALGVGVFWLSRYVQSPEFKESVLKTAREKLGSDVKITDMTASLFSGVTLKGIVIANPEGFSGDLLRGESFVLRYQLLPLLRKRLQVDELSIVGADITLSRNAKGEWNYEFIGGKSDTPASSAAANNAPASGSDSSASVPVDVAISRVELRGANLAMLDEKGKLLARIEDIRVKTSVDYAGEKLSGSGDASIETINAADALFIRDVAAPMAISTEQIALAPLTGKLAGGAVTGDMTLHLKGGARYTLNLRVADSDMEKLLAEAGVAKKIISGKLRALAAVEGTGGLPTIKGNGSMEVVGGTLEKVPLQDVLAIALGLPELRQIEFTECRVEFTIADNVMRTTAVRVAAPHVQIWGKGNVSLESYTLDHEMSIAFTGGVLFDKMPKELRAAFRQREDGWRELDFKVTGTYDAPKTDILARIGKGAADELLRKGLEKGLDELFKKKQP